MTPDLRRLFVIALLALLIGLIVQQVFLTLFIGALGYLIWLHLKLDQLLGWLRKPKLVAAPDPPGVFEDLCREIDRLRIRHKKRKKKLSGYLTQFRQATSALPDATVALGPENDVRWANSAARTYLGIRWPQDYRRRFLNLVRDPEFQQLLSSEESSASVELPSPVDRNIQLSVRIAPYGDKQRLLVARDVTRLHRLNQIRKDFVANVSHELRTPLTVLIGYLQTLSEDVDTPEELHPIIGNMHENTERMRRIIEDLLQLSKLEEGAKIENSESVPVPELIADIHKEAQHLSGDLRHIFYLDVDGDLWINGVGQEIYSAFSNIVFNAVKYTPAKGVIRIRWYRDKKGAHFEVHDTGEGIPPQDILRITERFYRVDQSRSRSSGGTGLGLAIVKHVLQRHNASLKVESELGVGSTFRCDFPVEAIIREEEEERA